MQKQIDNTPSIIGIVAMLWALIGVLSLLLFAIYRLGKTGLQAFQFELHAWHWIIFVTSLIFMLYFEGYKGFQKAFAPRVVKRAFFLAQQSALPWPAYLFAPFFAMSYIFATKKRKIVSFALTFMIICFIIIFQFIAQPLRGILDFAVCAGLIWGVTCIIITLINLLLGKAPSIDSEIVIPDTKHNNTHP